MDTNELTKELMLAGRFLRFRHGHHTGQEHILKLLSENGTMSQKELQDFLEVRPGTISETLAKLERYELVKREKTEDDSRALNVSLTYKGKRKVHELKQLEEENLYSSLTEEEQNNLKDILYKLNNDWIRRAPVEKRMRPRRGHGMPRPLEPKEFSPLFKDHLKKDSEE